MPSIINPLNNDEYKKERDKDKKEPGFETVKWASASIDEGKEVELTATVKDIEDENMVTLQVFPDGKGPEDGAAIASFPCKVVNGSVSAKWKYKGNDREVPPDDDPKFVFSAFYLCAFREYLLQVFIIYFKSNSLSVFHILYFCIQFYCLTN